MYIYISAHQLQAQLDSSLDGERELRETLQTTETNLMESRNIIENLKLENDAKLEVIKLKVCYY